MDSQIGSNNELSEVLANGNSTGGTNIVVTAGDVITVDTINETTAAGGVTIDSVLLKDGGFTTAGDSFVGNGNGLVVGHTSQVTTSITAEAQVLGTATADSSLTLGLWNTTNSQLPRMQFLKSGSGTIGSNTIVADGESLGMIEWYADDGTDYASRSAYIIGEIDGATGTNDVPGRLIFGTTADGANNPTEALRIDSSQDVRAKGGDLYLDLNAGVVNDYMRSIYFTVDSSPTTTQAIRAKEHSTDSYGLEFHTYGGGSLQEALRIDGSQDATFAGNITVTKTNAVHEFSSLSNATLNADYNLVLGADPGNAQASSEVRIAVDGSQVAAFNENGLLYLNETANANMTVGLTINQGANDDKIFALKSSDVAHGYTDQAETDSWYNIAKSSPTLGGSHTQVLAEDGAITRVMRYTVSGGTADTTKTTSAVGLVNYDIRGHDGANGVANITANGNIFVLQARVGGSTLARFLVDEDGDMYSVTAGQTFDDYDDLVALDYYDKVRSGEISPKDAIKASYGRYAEYNEQALIEMGVLGDTIANGGLTNQSQLSRLLTGGVRKLAEEVNSLKAELALANQKLKALEA